MAEDTQIFPLVGPSEDKLELQAATYFAQNTLVRLTAHTVPGGILNVLAKLARQEVEKWSADHANTPSLQSTKKIADSVIDRVEGMKTAKVKDYLYENFNETVDAIDKITMRVISERKLAGGHFTEPAFAIAVLRFELLREAHGIFYPALHDLMITMSDKQTIEQLQETIVEKIIERIEKKVPSLLINAPPAKLREAQ